MNNNYNKEWIEQRLYAIGREIDQEEHLMSKKSYEKLMAESDRLNDELEELCKEDKVSINQENEEDRFFRHMRAKTFKPDNKSNNPDLVKIWDSVMQVLFAKRSGEYTEEDRILDSNLDILGEVIMREAAKDHE